MSATPAPTDTPGPPQVCDYSGTAEAVIKGNIGSKGEKVYHLPGSPYYQRTVIDVRSGERWFCTERDALAAGWRPPKATLPPTATPAYIPPSTPTPSPLTEGCLGGQVDINTAPPAELTRIIHIGDKRAADLVTLRPFSSVDDLIRIKGIGESRLADIKAQAVACVGN